MEAEIIILARIMITIISRSKINAKLRFLERNA